MAKKIYIGRGYKQEPYLDNNDIPSLINTGIDYFPKTGFEIDFVFLGGYKNTYKHILNVGGTSNSTKFSLCRVGSGAAGTLTLEASPNSSKVEISRGTSLTTGTRYIASWKVNMTTSIGTFTFKEYYTGTVLATNTYSVDTTATTSLGKFCIFNSQTWNGTTGGTSRAAYIKLFNLKIYQGEDLVMDLVPKGVNNQPGYLYDIINETKLTYVYSGTEATFKSGSSYSAKEGKKMYIGVGGEAKPVIKAYIGVNGEAKLFYDTTTQ